MRANSEGETDEPYHTEEEEHPDADIEEPSPLAADAEGESDEQPDDNDT
jgi:hypothetical protein